jgi:hypothetical protein
LVEGIIRLDEQQFILGMMQWHIVMIYELVGNFHQLEN